MRLSYLSALALLPLHAFAEAPVVVTSIKPVYDLTRTIMAGVGEPSLLMSKGESPHHAAMRPSRMRSLAQADLVILIGDNMEPWLEKGLDAVNANTDRLELSAIEGVLVLEIRQPATLAPDEEQALAALEKPEEPAPEEDADFFQEEANFTESDLEDQAVSEADAADAALIEKLGGDVAGDEDGHDHDHGSGHDPHLWLDPKNSALFLDAIAQALVKIDPDNAETYLGNAVEAKLDLTEALLEVKDKLINLTDTRFIFNHDSMQYFESAFRIKSLGALSTTDALKVGARTVAELQADLEFAPVICLAIDQSESSRSATALFPDLAVITLDPMGQDLDPKASYPASLFLGLAESFASCN